MNESSTHQRLPGVADEPVRPSPQEKVSMEGVSAMTGDVGEENHCALREMGTAASSEEGNQQPEEEGEAELKAARSPQTPTAQEMEEHRRTHFPYRNWCPHCVANRGLGERRGRHKGRHHRIPIVGLDYWYLTANGMYKRDQLEHNAMRMEDEMLTEERSKGNIVKCIVVRDYESKNIFGHVVPYKGTGEDKFATQLVCEDVEWLGHTRVILKSDNEPALRALVTDALKTLRHQVTQIESVSQETSQEYDSQSSGGTEIGVKLLRGMFKTLKSCLESRIGRGIPLHHPLVPWLVEHAALILCAAARGEDGRTPWERVRGRPFGQLMYYFGESVFYKLPTKGPRSQSEGNIGQRMKIGTFVGYKRSANSYIVVTEDGKETTTTRAMQSRPNSEKWQVENLQKVSCNPWQGRRQEPLEVEFRQGGSPDPITQPGAVMPRRMRITKAHLTKYGFTKGCKLCDQIKVYGERQTGMQHTEACRSRIMEAMREDSDD